MSCCILPVFNIIRKFNFVLFIIWFNVCIFINKNDFYYKVECGLFGVVEVVLNFYLVCFMYYFGMLMIFNLYISMCFRECKNIFNINY